MTATMAIVIQSGTAGPTGPGRWFPCSAFDTELGVQAPVGFGDPAGLAWNGEAYEFLRHRVVETKRGRASMLACTGYRQCPEVLGILGLRGATHWPEVRGRAERRCARAWAVPVLAVLRPL